jgi:hypothetical protein
MMLLFLRASAVVVAGLIFSVIPLSRPSCPSCPLWLMVLIFEIRVYPRASAVSFCSRINLESVRCP